jgi:hypothetical protein
MSRPVCRTALREARSGESPQFAPQRRGGDRPDAVGGLQRPAAGLPVGERGDLLAQRVELGIRASRLTQRGGHRLLPGRRQALTGLEPARLSRPSRSAGNRRDAVVQQDRVDAAEPSGVLLAQILEQLQPGAHLQHVRRRDPRSRAAARRRAARAAVGASARSVLARRFGPRAAAVSAGSARCASTPARCSSSTTNRQPVQPSTANAADVPASASRCSSQPRSSIRSAGAIRPCRVSPLRSSR